MSFPSLPNNRRTSTILAVLIVTICGPFLEISRAFPLAGKYKGQPIQNAPDPAIAPVKSHGQTHYYMYCSTGPINDSDRDPSGKLKVHLMAIFHSTDLVNWDYRGDVFQENPKWTGQSKLLGPEVTFAHGKYFLYYTAVDEDEQGHKRNGGAIGVATSASPTGPWTDSGKQVVEFQEGRWVYDPCVIADESKDGHGQRYLFYGSYTGGLFARKLSADGLSTDRGSEVAIALPDRYEAAYVRHHDGFYYLFTSSSNCCNLDLTGYSVMVGRSASLLGPYRDRTGASFLDSRAGGTPFLNANGNRWIGPGHNAIVTDKAGQDWCIYAAVDRTEPSFRGVSLTKRAPMIDPVDWVDGWPTVRGGAGPSETADRKPAAQKDDPRTYRPVLAREDTPGRLLAELSDEFDGSKSLGDWAAGRIPVEGSYGLTPSETLFFQTQPRGLQADRNDASVLTEPAPSEDYVVETKLHFSLPPDFSNHNYAQAGLVIYGDDDHYIKLVHLALNGSRQIEFAKEIPDGQRYGNMLLSPPADWTYLRLVKRSGPGPGEESYTAYTTTESDAAGEPTHWRRGGTWTHSLGTEARIGLVAMEGAGFTAEFDYIRVAPLLR